MNRNQSRLLAACLALVLVSLSLSAALVSSPAEAPARETEGARRSTSVAVQEERLERAERHEGIVLGYHVRPGDEFRARIVMAGRMFTELPGQEEAAASENAFEYELESFQTVHPGDEPGTFVTRIVTVPVRSVMFVDGVPQDVEPAVFPEMTIGMTRKGDVVGFNELVQERMGATNGRAAGFMGIRNSFPRLPDREVRIGDRWPLLRSPAEEGSDGFVEFVELREEHGVECAVLHVSSMVPVTLPRDLEERLAHDGVHVSGTLETDSTQCFALDMGWPIQGEGRSVHETTLVQDGETVSHTALHLEIGFEVFVAER